MHVLCNLVHFPSIESLGIASTIVYILVCVCIHFVCPDICQCHSIKTGTSEGEIILQRSRNCGMIVHHHSCRSICKKLRRCTCKWSKDCLKYGHNMLHVHVLWLCGESWLAIKPTAPVLKAGHPGVP